MAQRRQPRAALLRRVEHVGEDRWEIAEVGDAPAVDQIDRGVGVELGHHHVGAAGLEDAQRVAERGDVKERQRDQIAVGGAELHRRRLHRARRQDVAVRENGAARDHVDRGGRDHRERRGEVDVGGGGDRAGGVELVEGDPSVGRLAIEDGSEEKAPIVVHRRRGPSRGSSDRRRTLAASRARGGAPPPRPTSAS